MERASRLLSLSCVNGLFMSGLFVGTPGIPDRRIPGTPPIGATPVIPNSDAVGATVLRKLVGAATVGIPDAPPNENDDFLLLPVDDVPKILFNNNNKKKSIFGTSSTNSYYCYYS